MRPVTLVCLASILCSTVSNPTLAQTERYHVKDLPPLGGTYSRGNSIDDAGVILGFSRLPSGSSIHAAAWLYGQVFDLGTLGGPNSSVAWPVKSSVRVVGISQTAEPETLGEQWSCAPFFATAGATATGHVCRGFLSEFGQMRELPTLGGENSYAAGDNRLGKIAGWAETPFHDPTCEGPGANKSGQVLQFLPVLYGPSPDRINTLPLIAGDSSGAATAVNDQGLVVGITGDCDQAVGRRTARHAVVWDHGKVIDIGKSHAPAPWWNTPVAINNNGVVVGFIGDPRDDTGGITHAFIWSRRTGLQRLVPGDFSSNDPDNSGAASINDHGQVVGNYVAADGQTHAFIWTREEGLQDLNNIKDPRYTNLIQLATDINDDGQITGRALDSVSKDRLAILLTPTHPER